MSQLSLGEITVSSGAKRALAEAGMKADSFLKRHRAGDWGELSPESREWNTDAVKQGERILSVYSASTCRIWIVTAGDRSTTFVLLPRESGRPLGKHITANGKVAHQIVEAICDGMVLEEIVEVAKSLLDTALTHGSVDDFTRAQIIGKMCFQYGLSPPSEVLDSLV